MGALLSIPLLGAGGLMATLATSCLSGLAFFCTSTAASAFFKRCNCQSSIATRIGFSLIFCLASAIAWLSLTPFWMHKIQEWSYNYVKMQCADRDRCYGVLAVHRITFALALFHALIGVSLIGVRDSRAPRADIQNGWWGPKLLLWIALTVLTFFIPNGFFIFWANYIALFLASAFILVGLVLLVDFAHTWSETCLQNWEETDSEFWKYTLLGSTLGLYAITITITGVLYAYFAPSGCSLNQFFISFNLALVFILTVLCIHPSVQEANPRSGLAQSSMVAAYCTYLIASALMNRDDAHCNPITRGRGGTAKTTTVVLGAAFTFLAIAYSTSRAATQSSALVGKKRAQLNAASSATMTDSYGAYAYGPLATRGDSLDAGPSGSGAEGADTVTSQPTRKDNLRIQALMAAVEAGSIPASALDEEDEDDDAASSIWEGRPRNENDDERHGTRYNYAFFHLIFAIAACYVAMLLTDWRFVKLTNGTGADLPVDDAPDGNGPIVFIGRSPTAMWMRVVSSWLCITIYAWSLIAPVVMPDRFGLD
ncbi:Membrane protein tms1 [Tilletia horrida]|uniref:Membrane protein tms1 n=1 Tax=Tilletia horrida TaxID=155126 RepID=A0AAN6JTY1_9BASI|nr:Membrane protein tms1 [Tilletia horrida]KAK0551117.1 Membrane protein tms1 [Tilletia horrida]KAK0568926.1 Membrane protein tms1 [Tilletia horrida]